VRYVYRKRLYKVTFALIDSIGFFVAGIFNVFTRRSSPSAGKILVIRADHIGDVIMATAVFEPLKKAFPLAQIDLMAPSWAADVLRGEPLINNVISFDAPWFNRKGSGFWGGIRGFFNMVSLIKQDKYDIVIDLRGDARHILAAFVAGVRRRISYGITGLGFLLSDKVPYGENTHEIDRNMALLGPLGIKCEEARPRLIFPKESELEAENIRKREGIDSPYAVLHVTAGRKEKNWTPEGFAGVIDHIAAEKKLLPVIIGTNEDCVYVKEVTEKTSQKVIDLSGKVGLGVLGPLCGGASLFVGLDSGPSHIAAATGVPCIILFSGVNDPAQWAPRGENVRVVCPGEGKSLGEVGVREVIGLIEEMLGNFGDT
jgi:ADP-heptose:LPS heptosyltransferase